jgi:hypothetical protein
MLCSYMFTCLSVLKAVVIYGGTSTMYHLPDRLPEMFKHANHLATKSYVQKYPKEQYTTKRKSNIYSKKKIITNLNE